MFKVGDKVRVSLSDDRIRMLESDYDSDLYERDISGAMYDKLNKILGQLEEGEPLVFVITAIEDWNGRPEYELKTTKGTNMRYMFEESELTPVE